MMTAFDDIKKILLAEDIEGFIGIGAPVDEYDSEAVAIAAAIQKLPYDKRNEPAVTAIIALVWEKKFGLSPEDIQKRFAAFQAVARRLVSA